MNKKIQKIGWIGTGVMGAPMAQRLMEAGYTLTVYNRTKAKAEPLIAKGAVWADGPEACAKGQDMVFTMVGYPKDVEEVYFGENGKGGAIAAADAGTLFVDMTTTRPSLSVDIAKAAEAAGCAAIDAPVSGGDVGAKAGTLSIMAGGSEEAVEAAEPVLSHLSTQILREGGPGAGQHTKMANQIALAGTVAGVCEAVKYGKTVGLDPDQMLKSIGGGAAGSWQMNNLGPKMAVGDYAPGFFIKHLVKDLTIADTEAEDRDLHLVVLKTVLSMYKDLRRQDMGELGTQALIAYYDAKGQEDPFDE
jgi:3-hydroxyisobutyrate dehydrogenase